MLFFKYFIKLLNNASRKLLSSKTAAIKYKGSWVLFRLKLKIDGQICLNFVTLFFLLKKAFAYWDAFLRDKSFLVLQPSSTSVFSRTWHSYVSHVNDIEIRQSGQICYTFQWSVWLSHISFPLLISPGSLYEQNNYIFEWSLCRIMCDTNCE